MSAVAELARLARAAGVIAVDTEFMGEGRYRTQLCLIQIAVEDGEGGKRVEILDPLTGDLQDAPLADVLADPEVEVVVHAGRQDIALLRRRLGCDVASVFDTQVAAGFLGLAAQCSYESLLGELLGVRLNKSASFTRWDARPLTPEQLGYAREDVVHLLEVADELRSRLSAGGRLGWARQECERLESSSDERDLETIFEKLPRVNGLSAASRGVARELVRWREQTACRRDRPVQSVLGDAALVEIAKRRPTTSAALSQIRGVGPGSLRRGGEELLVAVKQGLERPEEPVARGARAPLPAPADTPLIALAEALVKARAREAGLAYELLASRADLQATVISHRLGEQADVRTLQGWRRELVGDELLALLDGRVSLSVHEGRLLIVR